MIHELHELLSKAGSRLRSLRLWTSLAVCWLFWATVAYLVARYAAPSVQNWPAVWGALIGATLLTALLCWAAVRRIGRDPQNIARRIESAHPELGAMLLAALEQAPAPRFKRLGYLQTAVVRGAVSHGRQHDWGDMTSRGRLWLAKTAHLAALAALASSCVLLAGKTTARGSASATALGDGEAILGADYQVEVQPGNAEIERGSTLLVIAKFRGVMPPDVDLVVEPLRAKNATAEAAASDSPPDDAADDENASSRSRRGMTRSLDDPQFVGRVAGVTTALEYHVEFAGQRSPTYRITVFEYPELERADAHLKYPDYTRLEAKVVEDVRQVTAVEGTQLTLKFRLNKTVADARLVDRDGEEKLLVRVPGKDPVYEVSYRLERSQRFKLHLVDAEQRKNKLPADIVVNVTPNNPPTIKLSKPGRDVRVSPVEELRIAGELRDDFGVTGYGLSYGLGGEEPTDVPLHESPAAGGTAAPADANTTDAPVKRSALEHLIDFEAMHAEPDQLVSYYVWVEDIGPDAKPRRTLSDMYFAEVRHFDEIFRQGEQPTEQQQREQQQQQGQQGGAGQQAEELAELQKQVVNATWKLIRRETGQTPTPQFEEDVTAISEGQQQAVELLAELAEQVSDQQSQEYAEQTQQHMDAALEALGKAIEASDLTALRPALSAEQAAYQALLKLRAREFNVSRQQGAQAPSGSSSGAGSASQQQLQQLELSNEENRYETQSRANAAQQENSEQLQESRQILNRLRELARRQQDLNERLRELQASLEQANTPEEREELERQLKRLRDQQREVLRDAESLDNQMQNSENREQLQEAAGQLSETRSRVQQASEALEEGQISQALTEGARAEQQLNDLRDNFRRQTADRFTEEMRQLRDAAQQLDERQGQLAEQLNQMNAGGARSLRDTGPREEFLQGMEQQRRELGEALDKMRDTVTEAEEPEPLLARQLYDAVQQAGQQRTEEALDVARQLTEAGASKEAGEAMRQASRGVEQLRENVERAAESVLGDETEALRRADEQLRNLADALNREIQNGQGGEQQRQRREQGQPGQDPSQAGQQSEQGQQAGQQGEGQQPGQGQEPGQGAQGQSREGQQNQEQGQGEQRGDNPGQQGEGQQPGASGQGQGGQRGQRGGQPSEQQQGQQGAGEPGDEQPGEGERNEDQQPGEDPAEEGQGQQGQNGQQGQQGQRGQGGQGGQGEANQGDPQQQGGQGGGNSEQQADDGQPGDPQQNPNGSREGAQRNGENQQGGRAGGPGGRGGMQGGIDRLGEFQEAFNGEQEYRGPITGDNFREWSEGMREVEDMLDDPDMSAEVARIRDRTEAARVDYLRHSKTPDWGKLQNMVADPLVELRRRIADEIRRKESPDSLVPIDRDAAPPEFAEEVRLYYQRLGSGE